MSHNLDKTLTALIILFGALILSSAWLGVSKEWTLAFLTAALSVLGWLYSHNKNSRRESEARLFSQKAEVYKEILAIVSQLLKQTKEEAAPSQRQIEERQKKLTDRMFELKSQLIIWGSDKTLKSWIEIENFNPKNASSPQQIFLLWGDLYSSIRADLGHFDQHITGIDLVGFYLTVEARKELGI